MNRSEGLIKAFIYIIINNNKNNKIIILPLISAY